MSNHLEAKQSAAMKACIQLYENKELTDHFIPVSPKSILEELEDSCFPHWAQFSDSKNFLDFLILINFLIFIFHRPRRRYKKELSVL